MSKLLINIKELLQIRKSTEQKVSGAAMKELPTIKNAFLRIEDDLIVSFGHMDELLNNQADQIIDCSGQIVLPSWCDSHTHIVYAGNREQEFVIALTDFHMKKLPIVVGGF